MARSPFHSMRASSALRDLVMRAAREQRLCIEWLPPGVSYRYSFATPQTRTVTVSRVLDSPEDAAAALHEIGHIVVGGCGPVPRPNHHPREIEMLEVSARLGFRNVEIACFECERDAWQWARSYAGDQWTPTMEALAVRKLAAAQADASSTAANR